MIIIKKGNILEATENIICHQVNVDGIMGGGLAKQIASAYPNVFEEYKKYCDDNKNDYEYLRGDCQSAKTYGNQEIINCFTQEPNFDTDYLAIKACFENIIAYCKNNNKTIALPYKYGCGIAKGDWNIVSKIFEELSNKYGIDINIYKLEV